MTTGLADYGRAEAIARRTYADARRIGFTYAMASLRLNEANALGRAGRPRCRVRRWARRCGFREGSAAWRNSRR